MPDVCCILTLAPQAPSHRNPQRADLGLNATSHGVGDLADQRKEPQTEPRIPQTTAYMTTLVGVSDNSNFGRELKCSGPELELKSSSSCHHPRSPGFGRPPSIVLNVDFGIVEVKRQPSTTNTD